MAIIYRGGEKMNHPKSCDNNCKFCKVWRNKKHCRIATAGKDMRYTNYYNGEIPTHVILFLHSVGCDSYEYLKEESPSDNKDKGLSETNNNKKEGEKIDN